MVVRRVAGKSFGGSIAVAMVAAAVFGAADIDISADHADAVYKLGEEAVFTVKIACTNGQQVTGGVFNWTLHNFGEKVFAKGEFDLAKQPNGVFTVKGAQTEPGFLRLDVKAAGSSRPAKMWGVAFSPREIVPGAPCPADFMDFWRNAIAQYDREVTKPIEMVEVEKSAKTTMWLLKIPSTQGRTVYAYYSEPNDMSRGPYPLNISVPGAGPAHWGCRRAPDSCNLYINVHYYDPTPLKGVKRRTGKSKELQDEEDQTYAKRYPVKENSYRVVGIAASREEYFYYGIILAANRAVDWAAARPAVDRRRVWYTGTSQGGHFGLVLTALNSNIANASIAVPGSTDHLGYRVSGRQPPGPKLIDTQLPENRAAAERNAPYFCGVNFARYIKCPIVFSVGFIDCTCPPHGGYAAFNCCPSPNKEMIHAIGKGHFIGPEAYDRMKDWIRPFRDTDISHISPKGRRNER